MSGIVLSSGHRKYKCGSQRTFSLELQERKKSID